MFLKSKNKIWTKRNLYLGCLIVLILSLIIPVLVGILYAVPASDDLNLQGTYIMQGEPNPFVFACNNLVSIYKGWQGSYFGAFLGSFPIYYLFGLTGYRFILMLIAILFFTSLFWAVVNFVKYAGFQDELSLSLLCYWGILLLCLGQSTLKETFFWWCGEVVYVIPISCSLLALNCYFRYSMYAKRRTLIFGIILAFLASGGTLCVVTAANSLILFAVLHSFIIKREKNRGFWIEVAALLGGIINVVAPGNYVRHAVIDSGGLRITDSIKQTIQWMSGALNQYKLLLIVLFLVALIYSYKSEQMTTYEHRFPGLIAIYCIFTLNLSAFPVVLGYSGNGYMPDRVTFILYLLMTVYSMYLGLYIGGWLKWRGIEISSVEKMVVVSGTVAIAVLCVHVLPFSEVTPYQMAKHIADGCFKSVAEKNEYELYVLKNSTEQNVIIYESRESDPEWCNLNYFDISTDATYGGNQTVAYGFGKESVVIEYIE